MRQSKKRIACLALLLAALTLPAAARAGTLDQQQADGSADTVASVRDGSAVAQTFTAGRSGLLDRAELLLKNNFNPTSGATPLRVEVHNVTFGVPGATVLARGQIPASGVPLDPSFVAVDWDSVAPIQAGTSYALVAYVSTAAGETSATYLWHRAPSDSYPGGSAFSSSYPFPPTSWTATGTDQAFKTYVFAERAGTLDQHQADGSADTVASVRDGSAVAQTFTAGRSGVLDRAELLLKNNVNPTSGATPLRVELRNVSFGVPGASVLATGQIPASKVPLDPSFVAVDWDSLAAVRAGTQYALVAYVSSAAGETSTTYFWHRALFDSSYPGGSASSSSYPPRSWTPIGTDQAFKTYVSALTNSAPVAVDDAYTGLPSTELDVDPAHGVLGNDTDADGDPLTASLATTPAHGSLTLRPDGSFAYTPSATFTGVDSFTYVARDGNAASAAATVTITARSPETRTARVQPPINTDDSPYGRSTFKASRGVIPVKFELLDGGVPTCQLPPATIAVERAGTAGPEPVNEGIYTSSADSGSAFRISSCQYVYNLATATLGPGSYRVAILVGGTELGHAIFDLR